MSGARHHWKEQPRRAPRGCLRLRELPTPTKAKVIRSILGIRKRKVASVAAGLSRQKVLEVLAEGEKSWPDPRNPFDGSHTTPEAGTAINVD